VRHTTVDERRGGIEVNTERPAYSRRNVGFFDKEPDVENNGGSS
jgi:hypothetical protein